MDDVLVTALRRLLGTDQLTEMGAVMAKAAEQLKDLTAKVEDLIADVKANNDILTTKAGQLDEEGQAALDRLQTLVQNFDQEIGDKDGSETTQPTPPVATDGEAGANL